MSSPLAADGPAPPLNRRFSRSKRGKLRNGTFILPGTGERVRRQITLRNPSNFDGPARTNSGSSILHLRRTYSQAATFRTAVDNTVEAWWKFWAWLHTNDAKGILKSSLAYLLGSMATFLPPIANFLGHQDSKHLVCTITVYFHPSRSQGSMQEAIILGLGAFCYAVFISVSSMATSVFFESQLGMIELGYIMVLLVFIGGGLGFVGWVKQRYNAPLVSVSCSLASLAIITVITKENAIQVGVFSNDKIVQVMKMILMGMASTTIVSLLLWPISARTELRETMINVTGSFGDMLTLITRGFLSGSEVDLKSATFVKAQNKHKTVFTKLKKNLKEAKFEHYLLGTEEEYKLQVSLATCMQGLAHSIGGLRSAALTQFSLLRESTTFGKGTPQGSRYSPQIEALVSPMSSGWQDRFAILTGLTAIEETSEEGSDADGRDDDLSRRIERQASTMSYASSTMPTVRTPSEIFSRFIMHLGPSMKSLAYTLSQILQELPFGEGPQYEIKINDNFKTSLTEALKLYSSARADALKELYKSKELDRERPESIEADFEEVAASCGHFSFSLQSFAEEMQTFLSILEDLKDRTEKDNPRTWNWLKFWRNSKARVSNSAHSIPEEEESLIQHPQVPLLPKDLPDLVIERRETQKWQAPVQAKKWSIYRRILEFALVLARDDVRFAVKVGFGASLYAMFAFIPFTRPFYQHWRGEWGLLSYMLVCAMTIGASNTTGWSRFIGTFIGAAIACFLWGITQGNPFGLAFCGWLVSLPCFYIILVKGQGPFGRFIMLTYNLSCLYAYSLSIQDVDDDDDEGGVVPIITEIALHRVVAVIAGCVWGLIITRVIWPISARNKLKDGLSLLWLRMGLIWKRDPLSNILEGESKIEYMELNEEFALQQYVLRLDNMRGAAASEFELRGPFQAKAYERIMESTNKMLDAFHAMNMVIQKDLTASEGETILLKYTADERAQLCSRISHLFQVLASSLKLEFPLSDALPDTSNARDRLLAKIFHYRKNVASAEEDPNNPVVKDEDYEMIYAFILVTGQLSEELKRVQREIENLFGVMDENLFKLT
ncbi:related to Lactobacillus putative histidine protein kinase SppK [Rhynchosporium secalis]|uniref:Related to Lactobacillus putative histidine protein kinase SppK n=1 Tax=Rhynchosporium secalis TaxID=38038 RepID=A0A1E1M4S1_RHYSE|nr:related to Lactobacillus putative histidine protein kinase SppK [Rhynchosporium secalis]